MSSLLAGMRYYEQKEKESELIAKAKDEVHEYYKPIIKQHYDIAKKHQDIADRMFELFDEVVVGVFDTPAKSLLFTTDERVQLFSQSTKALNNVKIQPYTGLSVDFAASINAFLPAVANAISFESTA